MSASTPAPWRVVVEFAGIDLDDDDLVDALLAADAPLVMWASSEGVATGEAAVEAATFDEAVDLIVAIAEAAAPHATAVRVVDPLVTVSDIAAMADVTRQAVRNWSQGTRQSGFPRPHAVVGDGVRVWREADVDGWLQATLSLGSGDHFASASEVARLNDALAASANDAGSTWVRVFCVTATHTAAAPRESDPTVVAAAALVDR